jgi:2,5-diamino-6-(ribosylamino)-4(3H)-pyrimidinone 5'-phosphate reductase
MRAYIIIFSAVSVDGRLAAKDGFSQLSCPYDKERQYRLREEVDAVMVGANTVRVDDPVLRRARARVILSRSLNLNPDFRVFSVPPRTIVYTENEGETASILRSKGVEVRMVNLDPCSIAQDLYSLGIRKVMLEGGGRTIWEFVKADCYDEVRVTISPRLFGNGVSLLQGEGFEGEKSPRLRLKSCEVCQCGNEVHLVYLKDQPS